MLFNLLLPFVVLASPVLSFGLLADAHLSALDWFFAQRVRAWLLLCRVFLGLQVLVTSGRRTAAQQLALHLADRRNPRPDEEHPDVHMRGVAVDVNFSRNGVPVLLKGSPAAAWAPVYALAALCGISNGSSFRGYPDNNHFYRS
jgi:hypothetical protein